MPPLLNPERILVHSEHSSSPQSFHCPSLEQSIWMTTLYQTSHSIPENRATVNVPWEEGACKSCQ